MSLKKPYILLILLIGVLVNCSTDDNNGGGDYSSSSGEIGACEYSGEKIDIDGLFVCADSPNYREHKIECEKDGGEWVNACPSGERARCIDEEDEYYVLYKIYADNFTCDDLDMKDADGSGGDNSLILPDGYAWVIEAMPGVEGSRNGYIFKSDGSCELVMYMSGSWETNKIGTWSVSGSNLTTIIEDTPRIFSFSVTSTELSLSGFVYTKMQIGPVGNGDSSSSESSDDSSSSGEDASSSSDDDSSSSSSDDSSSSIEPEPSSSSKIEIVYDELFDSRDNQTYKTVVIGNQTWMAQNLNYAGNSGDIGVCFGKDGIVKTDEGDCRYMNTENVESCNQYEMLYLDYCALYGRLYDWETIMAGQASSDKKPSGVQGICPVGWHVPSDAEWEELALYAGDEYCLTSGCDPNNPDLLAVNAGTKLKSKEGWRENDYWGDGSEVSDGNGTDNFGFEALPGGYCFNCGNIQFLLSNEGYYRGVGEYGYWWTATQYRNSYTDDTSEAYRRRMKFNEVSVSREFQKKTGYLSSMRCVKD